MNARAKAWPVVAAMAGALIASGVLGAVLVVTWSSRAADAVPAAHDSVAASPTQARRIDMTTKERVATFRVHSGRGLDVSVARLKDGGACLVDQEEGMGLGASCFDGGLFDDRDVVFTVSSDGGPGRFAELRVVGLVSPRVHAAWLVLTDGSTVALELTGKRAFVRESTGGELAASVYPTAIETFGAGGKRLGTVTFPAAG